MAFATITTSDVFPDGTSVGAYLRSQWPVEAVKGAPSGSAVATATTSAGQATFSGLADGTSYVAYASVSGAPQYRWFRTDVPSAIWLYGTVLSVRREQHHPDGQRQRGRRHEHAQRRDRLPVQPRQSTSRSSAGRGTPAPTGTAHGDRRSTRTSCGCDASTG
jgi:hypothetical protein